MTEYTLDLAPIAKNPTYNLLWRLWFRNIITILLPFFLLAFMNAQIVIVLQRSSRDYAEGAQLSKAQRKVIINCY